MCMDLKWQAWDLKTAAEHWRGRHGCVQQGVPSNSRRKFLPWQNFIGACRVG